MSSVCRQLANTQCPTPHTLAQCTRFPTSPHAHTAFLLDCRYSFPPRPSFTASAPILSMSTAVSPTLNPSPISGSTSSWPLFKSTQHAVPSPSPTTRSPPFPPSALLEAPSFASAGVHQAIDRTGALKLARRAGTSNRHPTHTPTALLTHSATATWIPWPPAPPSTRTASALTWLSSRRLPRSSTTPPSLIVNRYTAQPTPTATTQPIPLLTSLLRSCQLSAAAFSIRPARGDQVWVCPPPLHTTRTCIGVTWTMWPPGVVSASKDDAAWSKPSIVDGRKL
mmetsp:Transcript_15010/g.35575  ORF Transcript_15010/g.35575 Transcript_15010/m.35575 type:complete len:281 (+) Transcript_15010:2781-3623(+)